MGNCYRSPIYSLDDGINIMEELKRNHKVSSFIHTKSNSILAKLSLLKNSNESDEEKYNVFELYYKSECSNILTEIDRINKLEIMDKIDDYITQHDCVKKITGNCIHKYSLHKPIWATGWIYSYNKDVLKDIIETKYKELYKSEFYKNFVLENNNITLKLHCGLCK